MADNTPREDNPAETTTQLDQGEDLSVVSHLEAMALRRQREWQREFGEPRTRLDHERFREWEQLWKEQWKAEVVKRGILKLLDEDPSMLEALKQMPWLNRIMRGPFCS